MKVRYWLDEDGATRDLGSSTEPWPVKPVVKHTGTWGDAGIDLFAPHEFAVLPHSQYIVNTYVGFVFEAGEAGLIVPRGGDSFLVGSGLIDTGYTGTIHVRIINPYKETLVFKRGDSVGQLVRFRKADPDGIDLERGAPPERTKSPRGRAGRIVSEYSKSEPV